MKFLSVLIIVFFYRHWIGENPVRRFTSFEAYAGSLERLIPANNIRYFVCVGVPVILVLLVSIQVAHWLLGIVWLLLSLVVLVYSIDIKDTDVLFDDHVQWLRGLGAEDALDEARQRQDDFKLLTTYEVFQSLYPALFWFLLLGPAGALLYAMSRQYLDYVDEENPEIEVVDNVVYWLEWPAARLTGLVFAFLGRFGDCFDEWLRTIADFRQAIGSWLVQMADAACEEEAEAADMEKWVAETEVANEELKELLDRTLFGWLALAAIVAILGF